MAAASHSIIQHYETEAGLTDGGAAAATGVAAKYGLQDVWPDIGAPCVKYCVMAGRRLLAAGLPPPAHQPLLSYFGLLPVASVAWRRPPHEMHICIEEASWLYWRPMSAAAVDESHGVAAKCGRDGR